MSERKSCYECIHKKSDRDLHKSYYYCGIGAYGDIDKNPRHDCEKFLGRNGKRQDKKGEKE